jgi:hypothetical protein
VRKLRKIKRGKAKVINIRNSNPSMLGVAQQATGLMSTKAMDTQQPPTPSCISQLINRAQEHNEALGRLIQRAQTTADRMFGGRPESKSDSLKGDPSSALGALEYHLMMSEQLATILLSEIQRLEVL